MPFFFHSTASSHYKHGRSFQVFHFKSHMADMPKSLALNTKSTSMYARSILHLLKGLYKHIQSLNVLQSVNAMYMHEECKQWKISESFGIWKKIQRFVVSLLLNWLDFWYADVVAVCFKPAITNQLEGFCVVGVFWGVGVELS